MSWLYGGYFAGWYVLFGLGYVWWLRLDPGHTESWWMVAFGALAYFVLIPSLLFGLLPTLEKVSARSEATIREGYARGALSRGFAFAVGLVGGWLAMGTCAVAWVAASLSSDVLSEQNLGETGLGVVMVALMMGTLLVIAGCLWLGMQLLLWKCRRGEPGARRSLPWFVGTLVLVLAWAGLVGWFGVRVVNATSVVTARLAFATLPPSDEALEAWLRSQPGIAATVSRQGDTVVIECALSAHRTHGFSQLLDRVTVDYTTPAGERRSLNVTEAAAAAGYRGLKNVEFGRPKKRW